jgi:hypothetical protein
LIAAPLAQLVSTIAHMTLSPCQELVLLEGEKIEYCNNGFDISRPFAEKRGRAYFPSEASPEVDLDSLDIGIAK